MIRAENISKNYVKKGRAIEALKPCSLSLPETGLVLITGETGSGKSTLLSLLSGLEKPTTGKVVCDQKDYASFVFQNARLMENLTLEENISLVGRLYPDAGVDGGALLLRLGLKERADSYPCELSGGEKQRAAILIAMLENKPVLFADEPTGSLDRAHTDDVARLLKELSRDRLVVVVTHDVENFEALADRRIELSRGAVCRDETAKNETAKTSSPAANGAPASCRPAFGLRETASVAWGSVRSAKFRLVILLVMLLLSFLCIITCTNNFFSTPVRQLYTALEAEDANSAEFYKQIELNGLDYRMRFSDEEMQYYRETYGADIFYDDPARIYFEKGEYSARPQEEQVRLYLKDVCDFPLLAGKGELGENEYAVSDAIAFLILDELYEQYEIDWEYADLIGGDYMRGKIAAVYSTGYDPLRPVPDENNGTLLEAYRLRHFTACTTEETYFNDQAGVGITQVYWIYGGSNVSDISANYFVYADSARPSNLPLLYGSDRPLEQREIYLSDDIAEKYAEDIEQLIGTEIIVPVAELSGTPARRELVTDVNDTPVTVVGIYESPFSYGTFVISDADFPDFFRKYAMQWIYYDSGISLSEYDLASVASLIEDDGLIGCSYLDGLVLITRSLLENYNPVLTIAAVMLLMIALFSFAAYLNDAVTKDRGELGVLRALDVSMGRLAGIYVLQCTVCFVLVFVLVCLLQFGLVALWNVLFVSLSESAVPILSYGPECVLLTAGVMAAFLLAAYLLILLKLHKKSSVDLVYGR